jgi:uncharacterized protein (DUF111 family)
LQIDAPTYSSCGKQVGCGQHFKITEILSAFGIVLKARNLDHQRSNFQVPALVPSHRATKSEVPRVSRGSLRTSRRSKTSSKYRIKFYRDIISLVETNVDDVTGEVIAATIERVLSEGAYDATSTPFVGKKGRPGQTIRIICDRREVDKFAQILVLETGTLGVKTCEYRRLIVPRNNTVIPIKIGRFSGDVNVKIARIGSGYRLKPELSEARRISEREGLPLRHVLDLITFAAAKQISSF